MAFLKRIVQLSLIGFVCISCEQKVQKMPLELPNLFSDHMVLQRNDSVAIWGNYTPGKEVNISSTWGAQVSAKPNQEGKWSSKIATPKEGGPYELNIVTADSTVKISDVLIGEVWLASGQSNMEMSLKGWPPENPIKDSEKEIQNAKYDGIRMFNVKRGISARPLEELTGNWIASSPATAGEFSATAYFFAKRLHKELNVPVGVIESSWGGTVIEAWTSKEKLQEHGEFKTQIDLLGDTTSRSRIENWFNQFTTMAVPNSDESWDELDLGTIDASQNNYDDSGWGKVAIPGTFDDNGKGDINGIYWLRKEFQLENIDLDYKLIIGFVDDMDATYINGQKVGGAAGSGKYAMKRMYVVPKSVLKKGKNVIAIRAVDTAGPGAVGAPISLNSTDGTTIDLSGEWKSHIVGELYENQLYKYSITNTDINERPVTKGFNENIPTVLFNAMINPVIPYNIKGSIWYQGESNVGRAKQYQHLLPEMITDWRQRWGREFSFYYVQIAPYEYNKDGNEAGDISQELREAQRLSLKTEKTGMVVTLDIGENDNIHPANKTDVGRRLAGLALKNDYGKDLVASGPIYEKTEVFGSSLILSFDAVGSGLELRGKEEFEIAGADKKFYPAKVKIVKNKLSLSSIRVDKPVFARYAWRDQAAATLFNKEGLPASSFSTMNE